MINEVTLNSRLAVMKSEGSQKRSVLCKKTIYLNFNFLTIILVRILLANYYLSLIIEKFYADA